MKQSVVGIVHTQIEAENLVNELKASRFIDNDIEQIETNLETDPATPT